jgi:CubicO group peptidase (beta-lactamase class C family)
MSHGTAEPQISTIKISTRPDGSSGRSRRNNRHGLGWELYRNGNGPLNGLGHGGYWRGFNTMFYSDLINNNSVVLLSNRGESLD